MPLTLEFTGKVAGDAMSGEMGIGPMGSFPFTGKAGARALVSRTRCDAQRCIADARPTPQWTPDQQRNMRVTRMLRSIRGTPTHLGRLGTIPIGLKV